MEEDFLLARTVWPGKIPAKHRVRDIVTSHTEYESF